MKSCLAILLLKLETTAIAIIQEPTMTNSQSTVINARRNKTVFKLSAYNQTVSFYVDKANDRVLVAGLVDGEKVMSLEAAREIYKSVMP